MTAKPISIKFRLGRFGGRAAKAIELTSGDLCRVRGVRTEPFVRAADRDAEVSRGHSNHRDVPADEGLNGRSGQ